MTDYDPILPPSEAALYLGFRGQDPTRSLRRLNLARSPMPGTGTSRFGYRLSVLNAHLAALGDPRSRKPRLRVASADSTMLRQRGRFTKRRAS